MGEHLEIEQKFEVDEDFARPDFRSLPGGVTAAEPVTHRLSATYYDTPDGRLAASKITLRRSEGDDMGWFYVVYTWNTLDDWKTAGGRGGPDGWTPIHQDTTADVLLRLNGVAPRGGSTAIWHGADMKQYGFGSKGDTKRFFKVKAVKKNAKRW